MNAPRDLFYPVEWLGNKNQSFGIMVQKMSRVPMWLDWDTMGFAPAYINPPASSALPPGTAAAPSPRLVQPLLLAVAPVIPGDIQRFVYTLNTSVLDDGNYTIYYVDSNGAYLSTEPFCVYRGSAAWYVAPPARYSLEC
jgi:hypothetical protein